MKRNLLLLLCLAFVLSINAKVVYVTSTGSVGNDGSSWDKAVDKADWLIFRALAASEIEPYSTMAKKYCSWVNFIVSRPLGMRIR